MSDVIMCGMRFRRRPDGAMNRFGRHSTISVKCASRRPGEPETWVAALTVHTWEVDGYAEEFGDTAEEALEELLNNSRKLAAGLVRDLRADMPEVGDNSWEAAACALR